MNKLKTIIVQTIALIVLSAIIAGCGSGAIGGRSGDVTGGAKDGASGDKTKAITLKDAPSDIAAIYRAKCLGCHGTELQGRVGANTNLQQVGSRMSVDELTKQIEQGEGLMPAFADSLTPEEIKGLAEWLAGTP